MERHFGKTLPLLLLSLVNLVGTLWVWRKKLSELVSLGSMIRLAVDVKLLFGSVSLQFTERVSVYRWSVISASNSGLSPTLRHESQKRGRRKRISYKLFGQGEGRKSRRIRGRTIYFLCSSLRVLTRALETLTCYALYGPVVLVMSFFIRRIDLWDRLPSTVLIVWPYIFYYWISLYQI